MVEWGLVSAIFTPLGVGTPIPIHHATLRIRGSPLFMGRLCPEAMLAPRHSGVSSGAYMGLSTLSHHVQAPHQQNLHLGDRPVTQSIAIPDSSMPLSGATHKRPEPPMGHPGFPGEEPTV
jgi:hypothetical protein